MPPAETAAPALDRRDGQLVTVARNLSTRYVLIAVELVVGLFLLPFNLAHLGAAEYGLWMLAAGVTTYFTIFNLGFNAGIVKFVAQYRARRDVDGLNEILSTTFLLFTGMALVAYAAACLVALNLGAIFSLSPDQIRTGQTVLLVLALQVVGGMAFAVFGGVINGFQRFDLNNLVGAASTLGAAAVNVAVLMAGYGLVGLVIATTVVRLLTLWVYRANAYRVFPALSIRLARASRARLAEVAPFSLHMFVIDSAHKVNFSLGVVVIGAFLNTTAVAIWAVAQRLADVTQRVSNQLSDVLFPAVVDSDSLQRMEHLRRILLLGTRVALGTVFAVGGTLMLFAEPLVIAWVGPEFAGSVPVLQVLATTVIIRVGAATAITVLKGSGGHHLVSRTNVTAALASLTLSLLLVKPYGLLGVAFGTLIPISVAAAGVLFPAGCRRVGVSLAHALRVAVWPAAWPVAVLALYAVATRGWLGTSLPWIGAQMVAAVLVYGATFVLLATTPDERRLVISRLRHLVAHRRPAVPVASEGA